MISGFFTSRLPQPQLRIAVHVEGVSPEWTTIPFVVDTGAALTCIHAFDAIRLLGMPPASLDPTTWTDALPIGGVGGSSAYMRRRARFAFLEDDGTWEVIEGSLLIGELKTQQIPALMGWDLLKHFRLTVDGNMPSIQLERL